MRLTAEKRLTPLHAVICAVENSSFNANERTNNFANRVLMSAGIVCQDTSARAPSAKQRVVKKRGGGVYERIATVVIQKAKKVNVEIALTTFRPNSENDSEGPCVERFIPVPVSAEIKGIDLSTRSLRIQLQNAFRRMVDQLNTEMSLQTNNFEQIDRNDVVLVNVYEKDSYWIARVKMVFKTGGERAGWSRETISKNLKCCKRLKILANEIKRDFQKSTVLLFRVLAVDNVIMRGECESKMPKLKNDPGRRLHLETQPSPSPSQHWIWILLGLDTGSTAFPISYVVAGLCFFNFLGCV